MSQQQHSSLLRALAYQFDAMGLPLSLRESAVDKIIRSEMDAGLYVTFVERDEAEGGTEDGANVEETGEEHEEGEEEEEGEEGEEEEEEDVAKDDDEGIPMHHRTRYNLCVCCEKLKSESVVLLIDHMWTTTFPQSREQLQSTPGLAERISQSICCQPRTAQSLIDDVWEAMWPHLNCYTVPGDEYTRWYMMDEVGISITHSIDPSFKVAPLLVSLGPSPSQTFGISLMWLVHRTSA